MIGGPGDYDDVAGGLGIDTVNGGPGDYDLVHGDYGYDRMSGGPGKHDIASFATAVAGGKGTGVWASLRKHVARGDGHDKLFDFEDLEGSAFRDTLIGNGGAERDQGRPGERHADRRRRSRHARRRPGHRRLPRRAGADRLLRPGSARRGTAYVQVDEAPNGGGGVQIVGGAGPDDLTVSFDAVDRNARRHAAAGLAAGPGCEHRDRRRAEPRRSGSAARSTARPAG